eukprot:gb/GFBE01041343.1/.p1 GENE.gb/GFBE01041343.1/~~gb/GFBE01041343.1/.p1  ORF type:complete len:609 (+),score=146.40 gb/GFBE01041343.1/:1-1827(+)
MPVPEVLGQCIADFTKHVESLQSQIDTLRMENDQLRAYSKSTDFGSKSVPDCVIDSTTRMVRGRILRVCGDDDKSERELREENLRLKRQLANFQLSGSIPGCTEDSPQPPRIDIMKRGEPDCPGDPTPLPANGHTQFMVENSLAANKFSHLKHDPFQLEQYEKERLRDCAEYFKVFAHQDKSKSILHRFVTGIVFKGLSMLAILTNTCYLGAAAHWNILNSWVPVNCKIEGKTGPDCVKPADWTEIDLGFAIWFCIELLLRMLADKLNFFIGEDKWWNILDFFLVAESVVALLYDTGRLSFLRIMRVFRLVRIVRLVKSVKILRRLRTVIFSILNSFVDLLWALVVVLLMIFVFSIIFGNGVASYFDNLDLNNPDHLSNAQVVQKDFGDLFMTMLSLWSAVSGGNDWMYYGEQLMSIDQGALYFSIFNFYIAFCVVGLFNVVTGVFVDSAVCSRTEDEVVQNYIDGLKSTTSEIKNFFREADKNESGTLTFQEFRDCLEDPLVKAYFSGLDIDPSESSIIFSLLDADKNGELKIDEFVNGTMKLKGPASKLDVMTMMFDNAKQSLKFNNLCDYLEAELKDIKAQLQVADARESIKAKEARQARARRLR